MPLLTSAIFLLCFLVAAAYVVFGILHMMLPRKALTIYRVFLGRRRYEKAAENLTRMSQRSWKLLGAFYITSGLAFVWILMKTAEHILIPR